MDEQQKIGWFRSITDHIRELLSGPPFLLLFFSSFVLFLFSATFLPEYDPLFLLALLYSTFGIVWRHATKDYRGRLAAAYSKEVFPKKDLLLTGIYQLVNVLLVLVLAAVLISIYRGI